MYVMQEKLKSDKDYHDLIVNDEIIVGSSISTLLACLIENTPNNMQTKYTDYRIIHREETRVIE